MTLYASVARACPVESFDLLARHLDAQRMRLTEIAQSNFAHLISCFECLPAGGTISMEELEKISFLSELAGCAIADDLEGEEPSIPLQLAEVSREATHSNADPIVKLSKSLTEVCTLLLDATVRKHLSERYLCAQCKLLNLEA